ncbi:TPM domain-containing protein [Candidatus Woesearchaeota archaeon]|nr:TPM domain-containing protein [Candidatus Woesearchaeota archaeon]
MRTRKGLLALTTFAKIILMVVGFFIVLLFLMFILGVFEAESPEQACRASISARANTAFDVWFVKGIKVFPNMCESQEVFIPQENVRRLSKEAQRDQMMEEIGELMAKCWWMFGNGQYEEVLARGGDHCHVCYSFVIPIGYGEPGEALYDDPLIPDDGPITIPELMDYLRTHQYQSSILYGGYATIGDYAQFTYKPQELPYTDRYGVSMDAERLVSSKARVEQGFADLANLYGDDQGRFKEIQAALADILEQRAIHVILITAVHLPEEDVSKDSALAARIIEEWGIGTELNNGVVFVFSVNNGVLLYGAQTGANALLPTHFIDSLVADTVNDPMMDGKPEDAVHGFIMKLKEELLLMNQQTTFNAMQYQNSYEAYITGGALPAGVSANPNLAMQGGIIVPTCPATGAQANCQDTTEIKPGERYAIFYFSPKWSDGWFSHLKQGNREPNMIGLDLYEKVTTSYIGAQPCNVNE